ncbi:hypothetical protein GFL49_32270 [Rhizobium leguminosarum bv. viciae]|nr:hypothetical protein [Rhizobium leguminosarum bv. viciae]NKL38316.1 hypothetical protein [Rhizobium leguminosarum bv. viciae]NKL57645.1 hypothetical protein [Rhizobium leguminosarum bv. viciae]NKM99667.1 hypothetical protein [Rhizobium leguminosarum bv. viciae]
MNKAAIAAFGRTARLGGHVQRCQDCAAFRNRLPEQKCRSHDLFRVVAETLRRLAAERSHQP